MAKPLETYHWIIAESFRGPPGGGYSPKIHVRPVAGEMFSQNLRVEGPRDMIRDYPVGTRFRVKVKLTDREGKGEYLYSHHTWDYEVLK